MSSADEAAGSGRGAQTAGRLRTAARDAFADLGWQATRVQDIVERAGVSHGTFYTYYDNKSAVLTDLVRGLHADLDALASQAWEPAPGSDGGAQDAVRGALERIIGGFLDLYLRDAQVMRVWLQAVREDRSFASLYHEVRSRFVDRIAEQIARVVQVGGRADAPPPTTVASALAAMVEHFAYAWAILGEEHDRDDAMHALVLVWGAAINALAGFELVRL